MPNPLPPSPPQLFCAPNLRCAETAGQLVLLDLSAGCYEVIDEVGTAMWSQLCRPPGERDIDGLAADYGISSSRAESDFNHFAGAQLAAGRLVAARPGRASPPVTATPRRRPSILRALRERAGAERDLRKGFAAAYTKRTGAATDTAAPRRAVTHLTKVFRTAEGLYPSREAPLDCLPRSLALTRFLRSAGWPVSHVIGVALYPFEAHAWVELDGAPLNESAAYLQRFAVIQRA